jgi:hypothetical protein
LLNKRKMAKHFTLDISEGRITWRRDRVSIDTEALTDGIYVIRTPVPSETLDALGTVAAYKSLSRLERDFRSLKADDLDLRPIWHWLEDQVTRGQGFGFVIAGSHVHQATLPSSMPAAHLDPTNYR